MDWGEGAFSFLSDLCYENTETWDLKWFRGEKKRKQILVWKKENS